jgi:NitT/TauT family transport system permease protein
MSTIDATPAAGAMAAADVAAEAAAAAPVRSTGPRPWWHPFEIAPPAITFVLLVGAWYGGRLLLDDRQRLLVPTPHEIVKGGIFNSQVRTDLLEATVLTTRLALFGLAFAIVVGMVLGIAMFRLRAIEKAAYPYLVALQAIPILAVAPLLAAVFGYGFTPKAIVVVVIAFFPVPTNLLLGMKSTDRGMVDLFRLRGASWTTRLFKLYLPNALPALFTAFRISAGLAVIGAIVGELTIQQGDPGLGNKIYSYLRNFQFPQLFTAVIWSSLLGIIIFVCFGWLGNRLIRNWHESAAKDR